MEETTNSIIVTAPVSLMRTIRTVIAKLDMRRAQVLVEAVIAEVTLSRASELGVEWNFAGGDFRFGTRFPSTATSFINGGLSNAATIGGPLSASVATGDGTASATTTGSGSGMSIGIFDGGNLRALISALAQDSSSNILSTPNIVTLDNEEAQIKVGEKVPFAVGQTNNDDVGGNPFTSFDREDVGLNLILRPQITQAGAIKMFIEHNLSSLVAGSNLANPGNNFTTTERAITTNVMVDNGQILVLGGLIQNDWLTSENKVPIIGDIPVVGNLFKRTTKSLVKRNLMIFLRPVILRKPEDNIRVTTGKYNLIRQKQLRSEYDLRKPFLLEETTALPSIDGQKQLPEPFEDHPPKTKDSYPRHSRGKTPRNKHSRNNNKNKLQKYSWNGHNKHIHNFAIF